MANYIVQKPVERDKVKKKLQLTDAEYALFYAAQPKLDGCAAVMVLSLEDAYVRSRTNEPVPSMQQLAMQMRLKYKREVIEFGGIVLLGEAWNPSLPQNVISGLFRQHARTDDLLMMVFDVLTLAEFEAGHSPMGWANRINRLTSEGADDDTIAIAFPGTYGTVDQYLAEQMALGGRDGIILRNPEGTWTAGRGTTGEIVKVKQSLSFDLEVEGIGMDTGAKTGRTVYTLMVKFGDKVLTIGSGVPHDFADVPKPGQIVEIEAMAMSANGLLREPRFKGIRHDKLEPDTIAA